MSSRKQIKVATKSGYAFVRFAGYHEDFQTKKDIVKEGGFTFNGEDKVWFADIDQARDTVAKLEEDYDVNYLNGARKDLTGEDKTEYLKLSKAKEAEYEEPDSFEGELLPYQKATTKYMVDKGRCFNADSIGLGKTVTTICALLDREAFPALVVVPSSVKYNWKNEWNDFAPDKTVEVMEGQTGEIESGKDVYIINYAILHHRKKQLAEIGFESIVVDEVHNVKNNDTKRYKSLRYLKKKSNPGTIYGLSGTVFKNRPVELTTPLKFIDKLSSFGGWKTFVKRYCEGKKIHPPYAPQGIWKRDGASNLDELYEKLRDKCMVRHKKREVRDDLPEVRVQDIPVKISQTEYQTQVDILLEEIEEKRQQRLDKIDREINKLERKGATRTDKEEKKLKELREDYKNKQEFTAEELSLVEGLKQFLADKKIEKVKNWLENFTSEKLIVFGVHRDIIEKLNGEFDNSEKIVGGMGSSSKQDLVDRFQEDDELEILFANIQASGEGIDGLQNVCSDALFVEFAWTPADHKQAIGRLDRHGQTEPVTMYRMYCEGTVEERQLELLEAKQKTFDAGIDGEEVEVSSENLKKSILEGLLS